MRSMTSSGLLLSVVGALLWSETVAAQVNPEAGDTGAQGQVGGQFQGGVQAQGGWSPAPAPAPAPLDPMAPPPPVEDTVVPPEPEETGTSDHSAQVGHFGVGFFGVRELPVTQCESATCAMPSAGNVSAPTIGARYWLSEGLGVEAALGLNVTSAESGPLETSIFGFALHGGVPLALAHSGHFVFQLVPQINFGITSGSYEVTGVAPVKADVSGFLIEVGATVGAEIHFGFMGLPQLSLQATVGLMLRSESRNVETGAGEVDQSALTIGTNVDGEPWDIFSETITAIYYF